MKPPSLSALHTPPRSGRARSVVPGVLLLALATVALVLYGPSLNGPRYGDDLAFVFDHPAAHTLGSYFKRDAETFFRPLDYAYQALVQVYAGRAMWPVHLLALALHVLLTGIVFGAGRSLGLSRLQAALAAGFMVVAQAAPAAVAGNDTLSQVAGAAFGALAVWLFYLSLWERTRWPHWGYAAALVTLALALLSKETSASFALIALGLVTWRAVVGDRPIAVRGQRAVLRALPVLLLLAGYLALRSYASRAEVTFGAERYEFQLGFNLVVNLAQFGLAALLPGSSAAAFVALHTGQLVLFGGLVLAALGAAVAIAVGLGRRWGLAVGLLMLGGAATFPSVLLNHVSELYLYNALPFAALLVGAGLGALLQTSRPALARAALALAVGAFYLGHASAARSKAELMRDNGVRAADLIERLTPCIQQAPPRTLVRLVNTPEARLTYSVYVLPEFHVLRIGEASVARLAGRPDVSIRVVDPGGTFNPDLDPTSAPDAEVVLSFESGNGIACAAARSGSDGN